jgi:5,10-methylenetetrahydromethanopterin reductase
MQSSWRVAGRDGSPYSTFFSLGCVLDPGEPADCERAIAEAGPIVTVFFHNLVETTEPGAMAGVLPPAIADALERYRETYLRYTPVDARYLDVHRGHLMFVRPEERPFLTRETMASMSMTATKDVLRERIRALADAGYSQFAIQVVEHHEDALERWAEVFSGV